MRKIKEYWCNNCNEYKQFYAKGLCKKCYMNKFRSENKEKITNYRKRYGKINYALNKEKISESQKEYYQKNKEKIKAKVKEYREKNKEKCKTSHNKWCENNKERVRITQREYRKKNRKRINENVRRSYYKSIEKQRKRTEKNKDKKREYDKKYRKTKKKKISKYQQEYRKKNLDKLQKYLREYSKTEKRKLSKKRNERYRREIKHKIIHQFTEKEWLQKIKDTFGVCPKCNTYVGINNLTLDHIYPLSKAYQDYLKTRIKKVYVIKDVQPLCFICNTRKGNRLEINYLI